MHSEASRAFAFVCLLILTLSLHLKVIRQQFVLAVAEGEGEKRQQERVQDADNGQDVSPAHRAVPQAVLVRPLAAHPLHLRRVPAVRVDHATHHHQHGCVGRTRAVSLAVISPCVLLLCRTIAVEAFPRTLCQLRLQVPFKCERFCLFMVPQSKEASQLLFAWCAALKVLYFLNALQLLKVPPDFSKLPSKV